MPGPTLAPLSIEAPNLSLLAEDGQLVGQEETKVVQPDVSQSQLFIPGVNIPRLKKYYKKWKRNINISVFGTQFLLAWTLWFIFVESFNLWQGGTSWCSTASWSLLSSIANGGGGGAEKIPTQVSISVGFAAFLAGVVKNLLRLMSQRKRITWECDLCKSGRYPTHLTPAIESKIMSLFGWRLNGFWTGFTIAGLGCVACVYSYLYRGLADLCWKVEWEEMWKNMFKRWGEKTGGKAFKGSTIGIAGGCLIIAVTNLLSRKAISNVFKIFDTNELTMHPELREKVFRLNKRNKIFSTVILCVLGLGLFIILKRLVIAVFNRSFNQSKW